MDRTHRPVRIAVLPDGSEHTCQTEGFPETILLLGPIEWGPIIPEPRQPGVGRRSTVTRETPLRFAGVFYAAGERDGAPPIIKARYR